MTEVRQITIKRALTRLKTIKAQLNDVSAKISKYGAGSSKEKFDIVNTRVSRPENHTLAQQEVASLYQKFDDLVKEFVKLKSAINHANLVTKIQVAGKTMTIEEALTYQRNIQDLVYTLTASYNRSVVNASNKVEKYNNALKVDDLTALERESALAEILYLVEPSLIKDKETFVLEFMTELDGIVDEANVTTMIVLED